MPNGQASVGFVRRVKGWQIAVGIIILAAVGLLLVKAFGKGGFMLTGVNRTADGLGWLLDRGDESVRWIGGGLENGLKGIQNWYNETDFTDWDWTFWD